MTQQNRFDIRTDVQTIAAMIAKAMRISTPQATSVINPTNVYVDGYPPVGTGFSNPMTTTGDIIYASETDTPADAARLAIGTEDQVLTVSAGGIPEWADAPGISQTSSTTVAVNDHETIDCGAIADDAIDHVCWVVVSTLEGVQHAENRPRAPQLGGITFRWRKDTNLYVDVFNDGGSDATVRAYYT